MTVSMIVMIRSCIFSLVRNCEKKAADNNNHGISVVLLRSKSQTHVHLNAVVICVGYEQIHLAIQSN